MQWRVYLCAHVGNGGRCAFTPLADRCDITLSRRRGGGGERGGESHTRMIILFVLRGTMGSHGADHDTDGCSTLSCLWPTCYHLLKRFRHSMFENRSRTTCSRFPQSFTLPVKLQLSGGKLRRESAVRWFGFCLSLPSPSVSNDVHVSVETPPGFLLTLRFSNIHAQKHTHTTHTQRHKRTLTCIRICI